MGANIDRLLREKGMTRKNLAERAGYSQNTISNIIRGNTQYTERNLDRICEVLGVKHQDLFVPLPTEKVRDMESSMLNIFRSSTKPVQDAIVSIARTVSDFYKIQNYPEDIGLVVLEGIDRHRIREQLEIFESRYKGIDVSPLEIKDDSSLANAVREYFFQEMLHLREKTSERRMLRDLIFGALRLYRYAKDINKGIRKGNTVIAAYFTMAGHAFASSEDLLLHYIRTYEQLLPRPKVTFVLDVKPSELSEGTGGDAETRPFDEDYLKDVRNRYLDKAKEMRRAGENVIELRGTEKPEVIHERMVEELKKADIPLQPKA